jgi:hypothetical protein
VTRIFRFFPYAKKVNQEISTVLPVQQLQETIKTCQHLNMHAGDYYNYYSSQSEACTWEMKYRLVISAECRMMGMFEV